MTMQNQKKRVVIVGAGASARSLAKALKANKTLDAHITVIQPNTFASVPHYQTLVLTKRETLLGNSTFQTIAGADETMFGVAVACADGVLAVKPLDESTGAVVDSSTPLEVPFDILVAATGFKSPAIVETPGQSLTQRQQEIDALSSAVLSGKNVVVAGGGATGVELAGDILESLPPHSRKGKVTLVCSSGRLIPDQPEYYSEECLRVLEQLGGNVIFNDRVISHAETTIASNPQDSIKLQLKSGTVLNCHVYVAAYGQGPNTSWLTTAYESADGTKRGLPEGIVDEKGAVIVNEYLQSTVYDKLYAIAATNNRKEACLTSVVGEEAVTVAANIASPMSTKRTTGPTPIRPAYQSVGSETFAMLIPENLPMSPTMSTICCHWCGFPCNLLCPCWLGLVVCGPVDPMTCGYCCGRPEGKGLTKTRENVRQKHLAAEHIGYHNLGVREASTMARD